jgi:TetR/AcrR family transcriptional regulator, fatty acid metabolism regulator protein
MTRRKNQAMQTKQKIFSAAMSIMQKQGFEETTIEQICKKANVSIGTFYIHYKSKHDVLFEIYQLADQYFEDVVEPELEPLELKEKILRFFVHYAWYNISTGLDFVKHLYGSENKLFVAQDRYMHRLLHMILVAAEQAGKIKSDMPLHEIEQFIFMMARGIVCDWCVYDGEYDLEKKMILYFERILPLFFE